MESVPKDEISPPWMQLRDLEVEIMKSMPPTSPSACHWLDSDAGLSYCYEHAWAARWAELPTVEPCPPIPESWERTDLERMISDGIGGCAGMGVLSDSTEACETCGCTLEYHLTDFGVECELDHFADNPVDLNKEINGELTYALIRIFANLSNERAKQGRVLAATKIARDVLAAIGNQTRCTS